MFDQRIAERGPGFDIVGIVLRGAARETGGIFVIAAPGEGVGGYHGARRESRRIEEFPPGLHDQFAGGIVPVAAAAGCVGQARHPLRRIARQAENQCSAHDGIATARQFQREHTDQECEACEQDEREPDHTLRPRRRHRISPTISSSTSGPANSGQVVLLTSGL